MAKYGGGGRRGYVVILEGRDENGWRAFAFELRKVLELFQSLHDSGIRVKSTGKRKAGLPSNGLGESAKVLVLDAPVEAVGNRLYQRSRTPQGIIVTELHKSENLNSQLIIANNLLVHNSFFLLNLPPSKTKHL
jgi:hypothetical protein